MPAGRWSGLGASYVRLERVEEVVFPGDKKARDRVHARLAKKIAAREAEKTERMSGGGDAALAAQMKQELVQLEKERTRVECELVQLHVRRLMMDDELIELEAEIAEELYVLAEQPVGCVVQYVLRRASRPECL